MGSLIDLHVHTMIGSMDSGISAKRLAEGIRAAGLTGVALTEHQNMWPEEQVEKFREETGIFLFNAREWTVDMGHVITLGLGPDVQGISRVRELREICQDRGAFMILCHPFRYYPGPSNFLFGNRREAEHFSFEQLAEHPFFHLVDAVEVLNAGCIDRENRVAQGVARHLGLPTTGGSDAHWPMEIGRRFSTLFEKDLVDEADMLREMWAGRFRPVMRTENGFVPLEEVEGAAGHSR